MSTQFQTWTWKDFAAMSAAYALVGGLAAMVIWPAPEVVFGATLFVCVVLIVAFVVGAALEPGAHL